MGGDRKREIHAPYDTRQFFIFLEQVDTRGCLGSRVDVARSCVISMM